MGTARPTNLAEPHASYCSQDDPSSKEPSRGLQLGTRTEPNRAQVTQCLTRQPGPNFDFSQSSSNKVLLTTTKNTMSHWLVVEKKGWLGFMNVQSGLFLGHDRFGNLQCTASNHNGWEMFHFQPGGRRGQVLLMTHWDSLVPVGVSLYQGKAGLRKLVDSKADGMAWEFVKVGADGWSARFATWLRNY
ncbi:hypothetical protein EG327_002770 [Venturia inaequalis]|uniref:Uncharacterized protein n=1 Tax=Venturia inaequalis TaxID=5025 RepID=A0A8H3ZF20_VENIN|nr:hypothetical protein EG327_002770 [Venturia inaequalis]